MFLPGLIEGPGASRGDSWLTRTVWIVPALPPTLFGISHLLAATGGGARRYRRAGWASVVLSLIAGALMIVIAIGASGMGGG